MRASEPWRGRTISFLLPIILLVACGGTTPPYATERDLQAVLCLGQDRAPLERYLTQRRASFSYDPTERVLRFGLRNIGSGGVFIEVGLGGVVQFDPRDQVRSYAIERHLTGP